MKYFIDTHDKTRGSFPQGQLTEAEFFAKFDALEEAAPKFGVGAHAAHVNLKEGKAFCFMSGPDEEAVRKTPLTEPIRDTERWPTSKSAGRSSPSGYAKRMPSSV